jgi:protein TonB
MLGAGERALVGGRWQDAATAANTVALVRPRDPRVVALRARAEAARTASEAAVAAPAGVARPLPSGNTDERAGFEEARETRAPLPPGAEAVVPPVTAATVSPAPGSTPVAAPRETAPAPGATARSVSGTGAGTDVDARTSEGDTVAVPSTDGDTLAPPAATAPSQASPRSAALRKIEDAAVVYPPRARSRGIEGWVDVAFIVDATGRVTDARVLSAQPAGAFDEAALAAVRRWRYAPPAAPQDANVRLRFRLDR